MGTGGIQATRDRWVGRADLHTHFLHGACSKGDKRPGEREGRGINKRRELVKNGVRPAVGNRVNGGYPLNSLGALRREKKKQRKEGKKMREDKQTTKHHVRENPQPRFKPMVSSAKRKPGDFAGRY